MFYEQESYHTPLNRLADSGGVGEPGPILLSLVSDSGGVGGQGPLLLGLLSDSGGVIGQGPLLLALLSGGGLEILGVTEETGPAELWATSLAGGVLPEWPEHVPLALLSYACFDWGPWEERWPCGLAPLVCASGAPGLVNSDDFAEMAAGPAGAPYHAWCVEGAGASYVLVAALPVLFDDFSEYDNGAVNDLESGVAEWGGGVEGQYILELEL